VLAPVLGDKAEDAFRQATLISERSIAVLWSSRW
jgi:TctA family transporter